MAPLIAMLVCFASTPSSALARTSASARPPAAWLLLLCLLWQAAAAQQPVWMKVGDQPVLVELADTEEKRRRGLMYRMQLPPDQGMLFVFPASDYLQFWMRNTPLDLDIGFFDKAGQLLETRSMHAFDNRIVRSSRPARYALEVNAGWFARHGIGPGARLRLANGPPPRIGPFAPGQ
jgi:uncharacterized membrane protein (UPF0127 family)